MIYQNTSSKYVIAKVFRDFGINDDNYVNDAVEWIGEALELIGTARQAVPMLYITQAESFRVPIPKDTYILDTVRYAIDDSSTQPDMQDFKYVMSQNDASGHPGLYEEDDDVYRGSGENYFIEGNFIKTSFEDYWVAIEYMAFPLDDDGYPLIPDAAEYKEALAWYIMMKLMLSGNGHTVVNYNMAKQEWERNCVRARNAYNMPDKNQYREFAKRWVTMVPRYDRSIDQLEKAVTAENVISKSFQDKLIGG